MMVRTIQHPGVQIQETEIGNYSSNIVMNNAYVMGFTDKGPIYNYSFITSTKEFTKIYGDPQNEAEKYMFTAVQSILANGGTPIVARMPYDNKQCKAYKALKMKWIDKTDLISPKITTDLATPIIPLKSLTSEIKSDKGFAEIFNYDTITINNESIYSNGTINEELKNRIDSITIPEALMLLSPYKSGNEKSNGEIYDEIKDIVSLKINGVYPSGLNISQKAVLDTVNSIKNSVSDARINVYKYDPAFNKVMYDSIEDAEKCFISNECKVSPFSNKFLKVEEFKKDDIIKNSDIQKPWFNSLTSGTYLVSLFEDFEINSEISGYPVYNSNNMPKEIFNHLNFYLSSDVDLSGCLTFDESKKIGKFGFKSFEVLNSFFDKVSNIEQGIKNDSNKNVFSLENDEIKGYYDFTTENQYLVNTKIEDKPVYSYANNDLIYEFLERSCVLKGKDDEIDGDENVNNHLISEKIVLQDRFNFVFGNDIKSLSEWNLTVVGIPTGVDTKIEDKQLYIDTLIPIFKNTINGYIVGNDGKISNSIISFDDIRAEKEKFELIGFIHLDEETPAVNGTIKKENVSPEYANLVNWKEGVSDYNVYSRKFGSYSGINDDDAIVWEDADGVPYKAFDETIRRGPGKFSFNNMNDFIGEGEISIEYCWKIKYRYKITETFIKDVGDDVIFENDWLLKLKVIYNNSLFLNLDESQYPLLEAKIMNTPEMGFKYGLYLDSEDCEISNDQYDDLVTVNQFKAVNRSIDKYGQDIDDANFIIVDKQKSVVQGTGSNIGFFTTIIDPYDALKVQRTLVSPIDDDPASKKIKYEGKELIVNFDHSESNKNELGYWAYEAKNSWNSIYEELLDSMDCLQRIRNADGIYIGEPNPVDGKQNILDSWSIPLSGGYYDESISKILMKKFPSIPMADISVEDIKNSDIIPSIIDHNFATHICVAVCKTTMDQSNGKIVVNLIETHFGSLFDESNMQSGRSVFIGDIINKNSDYIEFYRNDYVSAGDAGAYDPPEYRRSEINQIFIKDSEELKNAASMRGIDYEDYGCDALDPEIKAKNEAEYYKDLNKYHIYAIDKKEVCVYNLHWEANLTSFSRKESQKIIANTSGLYSANDGTTINIANNFIVDIDRCISFIKNIDEIPIHFICDAGLSTIAQFCDNVVWNPRKKTVTGEIVDPVTKKKTGIKTYATTGGWITQPFDPDNDPDGEDRYITCYSDISTWRTVVEKIASIASEIRKDCFAIIDAPRQLTLDGAAPKIRSSKFTNNFDKTIGKCLRYISGINNSYVAGYYNWLRTTDPYSGRSIWIPPTSKIIGNYCYLNISNLPWLAPAGLSYGLISGCHAVSHNPDPQEEDQIYMKSWNYIKQYPFEGLVVEGQRTLLGKESVFERINVRLLFLDLERYAYNVSRSFKYQVNNAYTREQFVATLKPKFEDYTLRGGIYEYLIKVDNTNNTPETIDNNELRGDIFIKPARLIEFILLNFVGTSSGVDFTELQLG